MATTTLPFSRPGPAQSSSTTTTTTLHPAHPLKSLLDNYTTSHPLRSPSPLPPSSRVDPTLTQRLPPTASNPLLWTVPTWIAFASFATAKGMHIVAALIKHFLWGPRRKSWGYRMTFIVSFMRNVADHTSLADIILVRRLISLHHLVPLPTDAVVTPITFTVSRRSGLDIARGFLRDYDLRESGSRELSGEWIVGTDVWKRLKAERRARRGTQRDEGRVSLPAGRKGGVRLTPMGGLGLAFEGGGDSRDVDGDGDSVTTTRKVGGREKVIYFVHGGAYYVGNAATHRLVTIGVSKACNARVFAITYRLAPEHVFPLSLHDVLIGYLRLLAPPLSIPPKNIIVAGDSAGGGLCLALCMYLRDEGYKLPSGLVLMSPWVDLTMSCGSWDENADLDVVPRPEPDDHLNPVGCYLGPKGLTSYITHPYASPLFGDLRGLPPMLIQSGDAEVLRDEITLLAHKATLAGVNVTHELYEDMVHVFQMFTFLPAAKAAFNSVGRWVRVTLPRIETEIREDDGQLPFGRGTTPSRSVAADLEIGASRMVGADGEETGVPFGRAEVTPDEMRALRDRNNNRRTPPPSSLALDLGSRAEEQPSVDLDSLQVSGPSSRSGSPTPTASISRSPAMASHPLSPSAPDPFAITVPAPRLRRALSAIVTPDDPSTANLPSQQTSFRRRRRTQGAPSMHVSPAASTHMLSNPTSPTPSVRRGLRSPSISQTHIATRTRSESHSDIFSLVEGYVE